MEPGKQKPSDTDSGQESSQTKQKKLSTTSDAEPTEDLIMTVESPDEEMECEPSQGQERRAKSCVPFLEPASTLHAQGYNEENLRYLTVKTNSGRKSEFLSFSSNIKSETVLDTYKATEHSDSPQKVQRTLPGNKNEADRGEVDSNFTTKIHSGHETNRTTVKPVMLVRAIDIAALQGKLRTEPSVNDIGPYAQALLAMSRLSKTKNRNKDFVDEKFRVCERLNATCRQNEASGNLNSREVPVDSNCVGLSAGPSTVQGLKDTALSGGDMLHMSRVKFTPGGTDSETGEKDLMDTSNFVIMAKASVDQQQEFSPGKTLANNRSPKIHTLFSCSKCKAVYRSYEELQTHMNVHTGKLHASPNKCKQCKATFELADDLTVHEHLDHLLQCDICGMKFSKQWIMREHWLSRHCPRVKGPKIYVCPVCKRDFKKEHQLRRHKEVHEELHKFFCKYCGRGFAFLSHMNLHLIQHTNEKRYQCEECGTTFKYWGCFQKHQFAHKGIKRYTCEICGKKLASSDGYKSHVLAHKGPPPYKCDLCDKGYYTAGNLKNHKKHRHKACGDSCS